MSLLFPGDEGLSFDAALAAIERHNPRTGDGDKRRYQAAQEAATRAAALLSAAEVNAQFDAIDNSAEYANYSSQRGGRAARESYARLARPLNYLGPEREKRRNPPLEGQAKLFVDFLSNSPERDVGGLSEAFGRTPSPRQNSIRVLATHGRQGFDAYQTAQRALRAVERQDRSELARLLDKRAAGTMSRDEQTDYDDLEHRRAPYAAVVKTYESTAGPNFTGAPLAGPLAGGEAVADNGELQFDPN